MGVELMLMMVSSFENSYIAWYPKYKKRNVKFGFKTIKVLVSNKF